MHPRLALLLMTLVLALSPAAFAGGKKDNQASVTFHIETDATDNPKMIFEQMTNGEKRYFRRMPEITFKDIVSFSPFPSDANGNDYGIVFRLKENVARRFSAVTSANQGRWLIAQVNGRVVDGVMIDRQVDDGLVVVWKSVTLADITTLDKLLPRIGQEGKKKKK